MRSYFLCFNYSACKFRQTLKHCYILGLTLVPLLKITILKCLRHFKIVIFSRGTKENLLFMGQWSRFWQLWRVPVRRHVIWYKKWNLLLKGCIFPNFLAMIVFHNLPCWIYESSKKCPIRNIFFLLLMEH